MPGVPSGRGCEGCRKQKKKCDQKKPKCSRCSRLGIDCIGAGQRRYKFITNLDQMAVAAKVDMHISASIIVLPHSPTDLLVASMIETMRPSMDLRYNLAWSFGPFLEHVPQRLGANTALDAAVQVIIAAHANHCARQKNLPDVLIKYSRALTQLRLSLDDALIAQSPETLCAVMLLLLCQVLIGSGNRWSGHGEGAARLLKARGEYAAQKQDAFEITILASLTASVLIEGIFNPNIRFSPCEWEQLIARQFGEDNDGCMLMRCLSLVPGHLARGSRAPEEEPSLAAEARNSYQTVQILTVRSRQHLEQVEELFKLPTSASTNVAHAHHLRVHSLNVAVLILLNRVLYAIDATASSDLCSEAEILAEETILLAQNAGRYAPLGSSYVAFCLCAAWMGFTERKSRAAVESSLLSYYSHSETDMIIDVLRNKMKELAMLRKTRTFSPSPARSLGWSKLEQQMYATFDHNDALPAQ